MKISSIKNISKIPYTEKVYDIVLNTDHRFFAGTLKNKEVNSTILIHNSNPDIDIDFEAGTDEQTLDFLYKKYGKERVVPVIAFSLFGQRQTLKDVARALGFDTGNDQDIQLVTKAIPVNMKISLEEWFATFPDDPKCPERVRSWILNPLNKEIIQLTLKLQSQLSHLSKHAAGIVITKGPVWESMPVNIVKKQIVSGYQENGKIKDLSSIGILKLDRLKLETLNIIKDSLKFIEQRHGQEVLNKVERELDIDFFNFNDSNIYKEVKLGNNQGIFQFESAGITALARDLDVESFDELTAVSAMYRPGPLDLKDEFIRNKFHPKERTYAHKALIPLLEETNGILIFQEQIMFIAHHIGGMTLGEGDNLRKVMDNGSKIIAKKLRGETLTEDEENNKSYKSYKELWKKFIDGAVAKGLSAEDVTSIESWLIKYLGYSFNKSHSFSYTFLTVQTLYLRHYYPEEFFCSLLNHVKKGTGSDAKRKEEEWLTSAIMAAMNKGIEILPPNRKSNWEWTILEKGKIAMGFASINGMGEVAFKELEKNSFRTMTRDQFYSTKWSKFNKGNFEACLKAGIFDDWSNSRQETKELREVKIKDIKQYDLFTGEAGLASITTRKKYINTPDAVKYSEFIEVCKLDLEVFKKIGKLKDLFFKETGMDIESVNEFTTPEKFYYFFLNRIETRFTKNGKPYQALFLSNGAEIKQVNMWTKMYDKVKHVLEPGCFYITKFYKEDTGFLSFDASAQFKKIF